MSIPKKIHLIWLPPVCNVQEMPNELVNNINEWRFLCPSFELKIWGYKEIEESFNAVEDIDILNAIKASNFEAMKSDIARLAIISKFGGFYSDVKNKPLSNFVEALSKQSNAIITEHPPTVPNYHGLICNAFLAAPARHPFFLKCLSIVLENVKMRMTEGGITNVTGANILKKANLKILDSDLEIIPSLVAWYVNGNDGGWMTRVSAQYNGKALDKHWSVRQKFESLYSSTVIVETLETKGYKNMENLEGNNIGNLIQLAKSLLSEQEKTKIITERVWGELLFQNLGPDKVINFTYSGRKFKLWLPYAQTDYIQSRIMRDKKFFEFTQLERLRSYIKPGSVIVDAGANIGNHSVFFSKICQAINIHAFEPQAIAREIFQKNIQLNDCCGVTLYPLALGHKTGLAKISEFRSNNIGATRFIVSDLGDTEIVALDDLNISNIDFMKVDIEGGQYNFLLGAEKSIKASQPKIFIELLPEENEFEESDQILRDWGYSGIQFDKHNHLYIHKDDSSEASTI